MRRKSLHCWSFLTAIFFSFCISSAQAKNYSDLKVDDIKWVKVEELHPTQFRVGRVEVEQKRADFEKMSEKELNKYLDKHPCPVVIGPDGVPFITDQHHRVFAFYEAEQTRGTDAQKLLSKKGKPQVKMKVIANFSDLSHSDFEKAMVRNHYTYLNDLGKPRTFDEIPSLIYDLKDDPFRSIAGFVQDKAYKFDPGTFFTQFTVADFLRERSGVANDEAQRILADGGTKEKTLLQNVTTLLQSREAKGQTWFLSPCAGYLR